MAAKLADLFSALALSVSGTGPIAEAALALSAAGRPGVKVETFAARLSAMVRDAKRALGTGPEARLRPPEAIANALAEIIGAKAGLAGDTETYDDLRNADLIHVLERKKGLPVTLGIIYMHVARALGADAVGLNMPSHFMVRIETGMGRVVIDPFQGGAIFGPEAMASLMARLKLDPAAVQHGLASTMTDAEVMMRLLNNIRPRARNAEDFPLLERTCEHMLLLSPETGVLWFDLGTAQARLEKPGAALKSLGKAIALSTGEPHDAAAQALYKVLNARLN